MPAMERATTISSASPSKSISSGGGTSSSSIGGGMLRDGGLRTGSEPWPNPAGIRSSSRGRASLAAAAARDAGVTAVGISDGTLVLPLRATPAETPGRTGAGSGRFSTRRTSLVKALASLTSSATAR
jgi:hypothetical protein